MKYVLRKATLGCEPEIEISQETYVNLLNARNVLRTAFASEEKYEIVILNFLDLEKQLLEIAMTMSIRASKYLDLSDFRLLLNARLLNLLSAARLYLDQTSKLLKSGGNRQKDFESLFAKWCSSEYDQHFEYRFMEALRNHVQHRGLAIDDVHFKTRKTSATLDANFEVSLCISAQKSSLVDASDFKQKVLCEMPDEVDLMVAVSRYMECLSVIHTHLRDAMSATVINARAVIESARKEYSQIHGGKLTNLRAFALNDGQVNSSIALLLDWDDVRIKLERRNKKLDGLSRSYVSNRLFARSS